MARGKWRWFAMGQSCHRLTLMHSQFRGWIEPVDHFITVPESCHTVANQRISSSSAARAPSSGGENGHRLIWFSRVQVTLECNADNIFQATKQSQCNGAQWVKKLLFYSSSTKPISFATSSMLPAAFNSS